MEKSDVKRLVLLETIDKGAAQSQRKLAATLKISLGSVNKLLKDLSTQGQITTKNSVNNKAWFTLTSKGIAKKIALKKEHLSYYIGCYNNMKKAIKQKLEKLRHTPKNRIVLYGAGELCEIACMLSDQDNCNKIMIIDDKKAGKNINGIAICKESKIGDMVYDAVLIMGLDNIHDARTKLTNRGVPANKIYSIDSL